MRLTSAASSLAELAKAVWKSRPLLALTMWGRNPSARAAACTLIVSNSVLGFARIDEHANDGLSAQFVQQLQPFRPQLVERQERAPVTLPPGRLRLATRPT